MRRQRNLLGPQGMGGMVSLWGASSLVKSVQSGALTNGGGTTATATITAVVPENTAIYMTMLTQAGSGSDARNLWYTLTLTNSTTLTLTMNANAGYYGTMRYFVLEYMPGVVRSIQRGIVTIAGGLSSAGTTITEVNASKTVVSYLGSTNDTGAGDGLDPNATWTQVYLNTVTQVIAARNYATANIITPAFQVVEFF